MPTSTLIGTKTSPVATFVAIVGFMSALLAPHTSGVAPLVLPRTAHCHGTTARARLGAGIASRSHGRQPQ